MYYMLYIIIIIILLLTNLAEVGHVDDAVGAHVADAVLHRRQVRRVVAEAAVLNQ